MRGRVRLFSGLAGALLATALFVGCFPWDRSEPTPVLPTAPPAAMSPAPTSPALAPTSTAAQSAASETATPEQTPTPRPTAIIVTRTPRPLPTVPPGVLSQGDARLGQELFESKGCIACHQIRGEGGDTGPALDGIGDRSRRPMLAGSLENTSENKWRWIINPQLVKPGTAMSPQPLNPVEAAHLVAYLETLR